jgi:hypothetical protein
MVVGFTTTYAGKDRIMVFNTIEEGKDRIMVFNATFNNISDILWR